MNQKERDKFPKIYDLMDELSKYDCDKQTWDELKELLESLEPDYRYWNIKTNNVFFESCAYILEMHLPPQYRNNSYYKHYLVNYTKPLRNTLKWAFIVVIGAFSKYYELGISKDIIDMMFKEWLEYKKSNG